jgi:hypothetical protein
MKIFGNRTEVWTMTETGILMGKDQTQESFEDEAKRLAHL